MMKKFTPLPSRSTKQTREYEQAVQKGMNSYFVIQNGKGWYVRKASVPSSSGKLFATKEAAVEKAKELAGKRNSEYLVFDNKGALLSRKPQ